MAKRSGPEQWKPIVDRVSAEFGVPADIAFRLLKAESGGNPRAKSSAGAIGLMQLMPGTARALGVDPHDPAANIWGGIKYLKQQFDKFGSWEQAVAAYNAGPGAVRKHGGVPPFRETQAHVRKVVGPVGPQKGMLGRFKITAGQSSHPIHYGTHEHPGVYDIGGNQIKSMGLTLEDAAKELAGMGYVVAVRKKGQRKIASDHLHLADPRVNTREASRLRGQAKGRPGAIFEGGTPVAPPIELPDMPNRSRFGLDIWNLPNEQPQPAMAASKPEGSLLDQLLEKPAFELDIWSLT